MARSDELWRELCELDATSAGAASRLEHEAQAGIGGADWQGRATALARSAASVRADARRLGLAGDAAGMHAYELTAFYLETRAAELAGAGEAAEGGEGWAELDARARARRRSAREGLDEATSGTSSASAREDGFAFAWAMLDELAAVREAQRLAIGRRMELAADAARADGDAGAANRWARLARKRHQLAEAELDDDALRALVLRRELWHRGIDRAAVVPLADLGETAVAQR